MNIFIFIIMIIMFYFTFRQFSVTPAKDVNELSKTDYFLIDVRTPAEFQGGHILEATNIPVGELRDSLYKLPVDKSKCLLVYCHSGARGNSAASILKKVGYTNVHNLGSLTRARQLLSEQKDTSQQ